MAEKLVNSYFEKIATLFPVVTKSEFLHLSPPPPLLLYSICAVAALSREVPREVLGAVKMTLAALFRENDLLSVSSNVTIRSLLIMSLHSDLHGSTAVQSGTRMWNRTGTVSIKYRKSPLLRKERRLIRDLLYASSDPGDSYGSRLGSPQRCFWKR